jgi:hypothetical protein
MLSQYNQISLEPYHEDTVLLSHSLRSHILMPSPTAQALSATTHAVMSSGECTYIFCGLTRANGREEKNLDDFEKWSGMWKAEYG